MPLSTASPSEQAALAGAAVAGDRDATERLLRSIQDGVYRLALRTLGHPADAEDACQEILVIVLTRLASFRGESAFATWAWTLAARHLQRARRGRREAMGFDVLDERLRSGLRDDGPGPQDELLVQEIRLRCTQAMLLSLDRAHRLAYLLGDVFVLGGDEAARILELEPATYRKRLSRARAQLHDFMRDWCGVLDERNPCRCARQVRCAQERGLLAPDEIVLCTHAAAPPAAAQASRELTDIMRAAEVLRGHPDYLAPEAMVGRVRALLETRAGHLLAD
jgi:RNA polymerase sigma factor (sigma-70 family)